MVIPNRKIVGEILHNYGPIRQLNIVVEVAYGTDINVTLGLIAEILHASSRVLQNPAPVCGVSRLAESGIAISITPWVNVPDYVAAVNEVNKTILERFSAHGIVIPVPQREVKMLG
ncbi:mechanosensitive ion channel domain-containing protein [Sulfuriferula nivalis]|uniref:Small-conductance mechanosensitive channel n=1 Tax=Sulfuriferula nivalis TaxID=2675298 RepID=A0A809RLH2_9PROT|nr:hypothetical protein SFSGTM_03390 [Sulfuriferula nivalis]